MSHLGDHYLTVERHRLLQRVIQKLILKTISGFSTDYIGSKEELTGNIKRLSVPQFYSSDLYLFVRMISCTEKKQERAELFA